MKSFIYSLILAAFIVGKLTGPLVAWSWWWLLFTLVPVLAWVLGVN